MNKEKGKLIK